MKNKERKQIAEKMAKAEYIIQHSDDAKAIAKAEREILELSSRVQSMEDITIIDEMVLEILERKA